MGFNTMMLYMEDTFEIENYPYFWLYERNELRELDNYTGLVRRFISWALMLPLIAF